jgi:UTP-glucose-1-phosphate uridylyltransferase
VSSPAKLNSDMLQDVLRLAIAYSMEGKIPELNNLQKNIKTDNQSLMDAVSLVASANAKIDVANLDRKFDVGKLDGYFKAITNNLFRI